MTIVQFSDTHVTADGRLHFGHDSAQYLHDAIAAVNTLPERPLCAIVTGDLVDHGTRDEYAVFAAAMCGLRVPYFVIPGNHDDRDVMREALPPQTFCNERGPRVRYTVEAFPIRIVALDGNCKRPSPGARLSPDDLAWLEQTLACDRERPTIVAVHQPPFASGLWYLDAFGFRGARALRAILARHPQAGRVISGHVHHVRQARFEHALATTAPSTVPQLVPLLLAKGKIIGTLAQRAGFALHTWDPKARDFSTHFFRRTAAGTYERASS